MKMLSLLTGLSSLLKGEFAKAGLAYGKKNGKYSAPEIFVGFLPTDINEYDYPYIVISPPLQVENEGGVKKIPLRITCAVQKEVEGISAELMMDILSIAERTEDALMRNRVIVGEFKLSGGLCWGVDTLQGRHPEVAIAELDIVYETAGLQ